MTEVDRRTAIGIAHTHTSQSPTPTSAAPVQLYKVHRSSSSFVPAGLRLATLSILVSLISPHPCPSPAPLPSPIPGGITAPPPACPHPTRPHPASPSVPWLQLFHVMSVRRSTAFLVCVCVCLREFKWVSQ